MFSGGVGMKILTEIFSVYAVCAILVNGSALYSFRQWIIPKTPWLSKGNPPRHLLTCRMCSGFWLSLITVLVMGDWQYFGLVFGASYFLACMER